MNGFQPCKKNYHVTDGYFKSSVNSLFFLIVNGEYLLDITQFGVVFLCQQKQVVK